VNYTKRFKISYTCLFSCFSGNRGVLVSIKLYCIIL